MAETLEVVVTVEEETSGVAKETVEETGVVTKEAGEDKEVGVVNREAGIKVEDGAVRTNGTRAPIKDMG